MSFNSLNKFSIFLFVFFLLAERTTAQIDSFHSIIPIQNSNQEIPQTPTAPIWFQGFVSTEMFIIENSKKPIEVWRFESPDTVLKKISRAPEGEMHMKLREDGWKWWMFFTLIFLTLFLVFLKLSFEHEFIDVFLIFKPIGINQQIFRDTFGIVRASAYFFSFFSCLSLGTVFFVTGWRYNIIPVQFHILLLSVLLILILFIVRFIILRIAGNLFAFKKEIYFFQFNEIQLLRLGAIAAIPFLFIILFSPEQLSKIAMNIYILIITVLFIFRSIRGFDIGKDIFTNNKFHFLIYICTLEVAPLVIIMKLILEEVKKM